MLLNALARHTEKFLAGAESAVVTRERHRRTLQDALTALRRALVPDLSSREDILAEELRLAARALGRLTGRVDVDDVSALFSGTSASENDTVDNYEVLSDSAESTGLYG